MLDQKTIDTYWDKGWVVVEGIFDPAEAERIAQLALEMSTVGTEGGPAIYVDRSADGQLAPRKLDKPFLKHQAFRDFVLNERLMEATQELIGGYPLLATDQLFMKPPKFGSAKPYHQDNFYFRCEPADEVITAWIALDDVDVTNGCMRYIDSSHKGPVLPHTPIPGEPHNLAPEWDLIDLSKERLAPVKKGGVVFHHSKTLHTSHRNESERWRRGYATHWVTPNVTCETEVVKNAYFKTDLYPARFLVPA